MNIITYYYNYYWCLIFFLLQFENKHCKLPEKDPLGGKKDFHPIKIKSISNFK